MYLGWSIILLVVFAVPFVISRNLVTFLCDLFAFKKEIINDDSSFIEEHVRDGYNITEIENKLKEAGFSKVEARYSYGAPGKISWRLSMKYPILMLGASKLFFIILPFYYLVTYPISFVLNYFDITLKHPTGTGLIVKAWK